ncbi:MAG: hypothetical protein KDD44_00780, partial [Bdellovibrionales bacterium]|nr:hypothetical protein [Bdellovibrionales bacterium]
MLKHHWRVISRLERVADNVLIIAAFFISYASRGEVLEGLRRLGVPFEQEFLNLGPIEDYYLILGLSLPLYNAVLSSLGAYRSMRRMNLWALVRVTILASAIVFFATGSLFFLLKLDVSRSFLALFCAFSGVGHFVERLLVLRSLRYWRARGRNFRNLLIVGTGAQAREVYEEVVQRPELGIRPVGFVDLSAPPGRSVAASRGAVARFEAAPRSGGAVGSNGHQPQSPALTSSHRSPLLAADSERSPGNQPRSMVYDLAARVVATKHTFEAALKRHAVDEVLFTDVIQHLPDVEELAALAVDEGIHIALRADFFSLGISRSDTSYFGTIPLIHYQPSPGDSSALVLKRVMDIVVSASLLILLAPVMALVAVVIAVESGFPV